MFVLWIEGPVFPIAGRGGGQFHGESCSSVWHR